MEVRARNAALLLKYRALRAQFLNVTVFRLVV